MKKFLGLVLALILAVVFVVPASAAAPSPRLSVVMETPVFQGETTVIAVSANNPGVRPASLVWVINFPKGVFSKIQLVVNGRPTKLTLSRDGSYLWRANIKGGKLATVNFVVTYSKEVSGQITALKIFDQKARNRQLGQYDVNVEVPTLIITSSSPNDPILTGGVPMTVRIQIQNPAPFSLPFDTNTIFPNTGATDGTHPRSIGEMGTSDLYVDENGSTIIHWWGNIPAGQTFTMEVYTNSGPSAGTFVLFGFDDLLSDVVYADKTIVLEAQKVPAELAWTLSSPDEVARGGNPILIEIVAENKTGQPVDFYVSSYIFFNGGATNRNIDYSMSGGSVDFSGDPYGATIRWFGRIPDGQTWTFQILTASGSVEGMNPGTYPLFVFDDLMTDVVYATKMIVVQ